MERNTSENLSTQLENIVLMYPADTIFILGKGASIDLVDRQLFAEYLTIGINDVERICPVDITVFHSDWVIGGLRESGFRSKLYLSAKPFEPTNGVNLVLPYVPMSQESSDMLMQRFASQDVIIEDILFLTALKIAKKIADIKKKNVSVYMVGFDFNLNAGQSHHLERNYAAVDKTNARLLVNLQENFFLNALYFCKNSNIVINHVGSRNFSTIKPDELNAQFAKSSATISHEHKVKIVAELTTNHFGDRVRLERMIRIAKGAGADYVKLQKRDVETFYSKEQLESPYRSPFGATFRDYRMQLELKKDDFDFVDKICKEAGIGWFASVLDKTSFLFMQEYFPRLVKLPSTISEHKEYLRYIADNYTGELVLSTGMTDQEYEDFVLENFSKVTSLYLLQCNSAYPTPDEDCNIGVIRHYYELSKRDPRIIPGYSSHDLGAEASMLAVAAGARMVEKHVKLGNAEWAHFDSVALDLTKDDFHNYVAKVRSAEVMLGSETKKVNLSEHHKYSWSRGNA